MLRALRTSAWIVAGFFAIAMLTQPVSVDAQAGLAIAAIVAMILIWKFGKGFVARQMFLALGSFIVVRYMYWRITNTMPPIADTVGFAFGLVLLTAEIYCVVILAISLTINAAPLKRKPLEREDDELLPTVDVYIPTYNEDEYILATTIAAAKSMDYPPEKLNVWLLDDGGTDQKCNDSNPEKALAARTRRSTLQTLCQQMGAIYLTRKKNEHAKAGNMNHALKVSNGEIVVVFDADHAPFRAFLRETVGHFRKDPKMFLVQTPHVFLNPDPIEKNLVTFAKMPSENEMFYSVTQRGLDKWNGSFFCGSAALLRRSALETVGGFSGITITEDCETALDLHGSGWNSAFVEKPLIAGLQPETFSSFIGQRSRWCQGMFQILMLKNPVMKKGLSVIQKLCYLSSMTFWFFPIPRLIFMLMPLIYICFDIKIFVSNIDEAIAYTLTYIIVNLMLQNYLYGRVRWPWVSELYEYLQGVFLAKAIVSVAANPRAPSFNVTAKGLTLDNDHISELAWPFFAIWGALFAADLVAIWRYFFDPNVSHLMIVVGAWNTFNLIIAGVALGCVAERKQPDRHPRLFIDRVGKLFHNGQAYPVAIKNVSAGGCAMEITGEGAKPAIGEDDELSLWVEPQGVVIKQERIRLKYKRTDTGPDADLWAFEFPDLRPEEYYVLADLMYADSDALPRFLMSRRKHKNVFAGTGRFILWGLVEPFRAFSYLEFFSKKKEEAAGEQAGEAAAETPVEEQVQDQAAMLRKLLAIANSGATNTPGPQPAAATDAKIA